MCRLIKEGYYKFFFGIKCTSTIHSNLHYYICPLNEDIDAYIIDDPRCMFLKLFDEAANSWDFIASMVNKWVCVCECWWNDTNGRTEVLWLLMHSLFSLGFTRSRILHKLKTNKYRTFLGLLDSEDEGIMTLGYTGSYSPSVSLLHPRRLESSTKNNDCTKCSTWHHHDTICMFCDTVTSEIFWAIVKRILTVCNISNS